MKIQKSILKGALIFGVLGFIVYVFLMFLGAAMASVGLTCDCFRVFSYALIGIAFISGSVVWAGCCAKKPEEENLAS